jgi:RES domain-containing protein
MHPMPQAERKAGGIGPVKEYSKAAATVAGAMLEMLVHYAAVLIVPSFVARGEGNYLLNPLHREFRHVRFPAPEIFHFDPRFK